MIWVLIEMNIKGTKKKFMGAKNYDTLIKYINTFEDVRKLMIIISIRMIRNL